MIFSDLVLDTSHTLGSNYLLDQLQRSIESVKLWCDDNDILNKFTLQLFLPIFQVFLWKGDVSIFIKNVANNIYLRLSWI